MSDPWAAWTGPEGLSFVGTVAIGLLYIWTSSKFETKKTKQELDAEEEKLKGIIADQVDLISARASDTHIRTIVSSMITDHIVEGAASRAEEIRTVGRNEFVLRTTHHDAVGNLDAKLQRILVDQAAQGASIQNLDTRMSALAVLVGQTNQELRGIGENVAHIAGIWQEHVRQHGGLAISKVRGT